MSPERIPLSDKDLWRSLARDTGVASAAVSDLDFAAWLEGRLSETEAARIDAAVASDAELRQAALELANILGKPLPAAPPRMTVRAQALVGFEVERRSARRSWWATLLPSFSSGFAFQPGAIAGMAVMIAAVGFMMGGGLGESFAQEKYVASQPSTIVTNFLGSDSSSQLNDLFAMDNP
jgi:hypothetical protein